jgi:hypothetical protein
MNTHLSSGDFDLPGPALLRKTFHPRQRLTITELSQVIGLSRDRIYKRIRAGKFDLCVRRNECGTPFVLLEDVIQYLYPSASLSPACHPDPVPAPVKRRPGRPRKSSSAPGGAR